MERLNYIINELKEIREENNLKSSDDNLFDNAIKIYISENISNDKKNGYQKETYPKKETNDKPTDKQVNYLKRIGVKIMPNTKQEARIMIDTYIKRLEEKRK